MTGFEYPQHGSDVRIRAWGADLSDTVTRLILAFWRLVAERESVPAQRELRVSVTAQDHEELVVNLLNELIFLTDAGLFVARDVLSVSLTEPGHGSWGSSEEFAATVVLSGAPAQSMEAPLMRYFKGATYHDLLVTDREIAVTLDI